MSLNESLANNAMVRLLIRVYRHFDTVPAAIKPEHYRFYIISNIAYTVAWMTHVVWLFAFLCIGQYTMMWIQLISIGWHVVAINLNRRGYLQTAMMVGSLEVVCHQLLAVYLLGWGAGFQYLIPAIAIFPFLKHDGSLVIKSLLVLCAMFSFLYLEVFMKTKLPVYILSPAAVNGFNYSNIVFCFVLIATWGVFITIAIRRSEEILIRKNVELANSNNEILLRNKLIEQEKKRSEDLLLNILPSEVAEELKDTGHAAAKYFEHVTVMFTDFVNFTHISEQMSPQELIDELDCCFKAFDGITGKYNIEKIKTIGDAYLAVTGMPKADPLHAVEIINAAIEINTFIQTRRRENGVNTFEVRIGVHSGSVVAGIVGVKKFAYDIWGDTVNVAARMEQNSEPGRINISQTTYDLIKDKFTCTYRGEIEAKNKGKLGMYFVEGTIA